MLSTNATANCTSAEERTATASSPSGEEVMMLNREFQVNCDTSQATPKKTSAPKTVNATGWRRRPRKENPSAARTRMGNSLNSQVIAKREDLKSSLSTCHQTPNG